MVDKDFLKFNNGINLSLNNFKLENLGLLILSEQEKFYSIFKNYDKNNSKSIDTIEEINAIWSDLKKAANKNEDASTLDNEEISLLLKDKFNDTDFDVQNNVVFLNIIRKIFGEQHKDDENSALEFLSQILAQSQTTYQAQLNRDNWISESYNYYKDLFNTEFSRKNLNRNLEEFSNFFVELQNSKNFREDFEKLTGGIKFDINKIKITEEKAKKMAGYQAYTDIIQGMKNKLNNALVNSTENAFGNLKHTGGEIEICKILKDLGYKDINYFISNFLNKYKDNSKIKDYVKEDGYFHVSYYEDGSPAGISYDSKSGRKVPITQEMAQLIGQEINLILNQIYAYSLNLKESDIIGKNNDELQELCLKRYEALNNDYEKTFQSTYGKTNVQRLAQSYSMSQLKGQAYINMGVNLLAMCGALFSGGTLALTSAAVMIANPTDFIARATDKDGMTKKDWSDYGNTIVDSLKWMAVGMGAAKIGQAVSGYLKINGIINICKQSGKPLNEVIDILSNGKNVPKDISKAFKQVKLISASMGVSTEVAANIGMIYALQKDGATNVDWALSLIFATAGHGTFKNVVAKIINKKAKPKELLKDIKDIFSSLKMTDEEALLVYKRVEKMNLKEQRKFFEQPIELSEINILHQSEPITGKTIREGYKKTEIFEPKKFCINDPIYGDITKCSEYLASKIENQMGIITSDDIAGMVSRVSKKMNIPEKEVLRVMSKITQFGSYKKYYELGRILSDKNIGAFYNSQISANVSLQYLTLSKKQLKLEGNKKAFILDDAGLNYLQKMSSNDLVVFKARVKNGDIVLINLEGTGIKLGNEYYSYTIFDGSQNLEYLTEAVLSEVKKGKKLEKVINGDYSKRVEEILGKSYAKKIENVSLIDDKKYASPVSIAEQISPNRPTKYEIQATIEVWVEHLISAEVIAKEDAERAKSLLAMYVDHMIQAPSNDSMVEILRDKHTKIMEQVTKMGKTADDVIYVYPHEYSSFGLVDYMYSKANGISVDKFIKTSDCMELPQNKVYVLLDDIIGTGRSMLEEQFCYRASFYSVDFIKCQKNSTLIFAPIFASKEGVSNINRAIRNSKRQDICLVDDNMITSSRQFLEQISKEDSELLSNVLGTASFGQGNMCTAFPYMIPDNNSAFSGYMLSFCLNDPTALNANKTKAYLSNLYDKIYERADFLASKSRE